MRPKLALAALALLALGVAPAGAAERCGHAVVFMLPGVTWRDVERVDARHVLAAAEDGAVGSMSVNVGGSATSYAAALATIGAGTRAEADHVLAVPSSAGRLLRAARVANIAAIREQTAQAGYRARPGALASSLEDPVIAIGTAGTPNEPSSGSAVLLAAMDRDGRVDLAATGPEVLDPDAMTRAIDKALRVRCSTVIVDSGDLLRARGAGGGETFESALASADALFGYVREQITPDDLLLVVTPTSPARLPEDHLGVAVAVGPGFPAGSTLQSASTRLPGIVTLSDVAPTVLEYKDVDLPPSMLGRPFYTVGGTSDRVDEAVELDRESVFVHGLQNEVLTWYVVLQILLYAAAAYLLARSNGGSGASRMRGAVRIGALAIVLFPASAYLAGTVQAHELGTGWYVALLVLVDALVTGAVALLARRPLDGLLLALLVSFAVVVADTLLGGPLQLNTIFGNLPILGARFAGLGNNAFVVLGAATVLGGAMIVQRWGVRTAALGAAGGLFAVAVIVDGAPQLGSDIGGVIALVPSLVLTFFLLAGRSVGWRFVAFACLGAAAVLAVFLALDLTGPPEVRSHLGRLAEAVRDRGFGVLFDTIGRKLETNLGVFDVTFWTFFVPPVLGGLAWLLLRWRSLAQRCPQLRAGMIGALLMAVLGFAVNDSGIIIPAMFLPFLVPAALVAAIALQEHVAAPPGASSAADARAEPPRSEGARARA